MTFVGGCAVRMVKERVTREECLEALTESHDDVSDEVSHTLTTRKRWGRLIDASGDTVFVCQMADASISKVLSANGNEVPMDSVILIPTQQRVVLENCFEKRPWLFAKLSPRPWATT